jgi:hypothetical protein
MQSAALIERAAVDFVRPGRVPGRAKRRGRDKAGHDDVGSGVDVASGEAEYFDAALRR